MTQQDAVRPTGPERGALGVVAERLRTTDGSPADPDAVYEAFVEWVGAQGLTLYPAQDEAVIEAVSGAHVVLATPTGSGKSMVAVAAHLAALADGRRTFYTAPIKALVSEKFFALCDVFGPERVGMLTGDAAVNASAPIICCTAEVLANIALRGGRAADVGQVVMDEFHFYSEPERGWAWQVPLLELPQTQFLLMSATLGDTTRFEEDLTRRSGRPTAVVTSVERPVPLSYEWAMTPLHETLEELLATRRAPVYVVHFTQAAALERAQALMSVTVATRAERDEIAEAIGGFRFSAGFGRTLSRLVRHGIGVHHAGMLPKYRRLVEQLAQRGLLKVICGTDTLGVGINVPIRTVLLTGLTKFDGSRMRLLRAREFHQIAGRAGRAGYDTSGTVVVQAPDHVIENARALAKAGDDPKKQRKVQRKKAPDGFVAWSEDTFERIVAAEPEPLVSRMRVTHAMVLQVLQRDEDPVEAFRHLLRDNHEEPRRQVRLVRQAVQIYRSLLAAGVVEQLPSPDEDGRIVRLVEDLQLGFALNQPLSAFALGAIEVLDPDSATYALDVVSVIEATLEDPRPILMAQQYAARGEAVAEMKADGIEYDERMELLEDVSYPRPLDELLSALFETYRGRHPWVPGTALSPKSVVRDMWERALGFGDLVRLYGLSRSEGIVLRYLSDAYRALRQTVPESARTDELDELVTWLGTVVHQTDSSLVDEWEALTAGEDDPDAVRRPDGTAPPPRRLSTDRRALTVLLRNALFHRARMLAVRDWVGLAALDPDPEPVGGVPVGRPGWDADRWAQAGEEYSQDHDEVLLGPDARGPAFFQVHPDPEDLVPLGVPVPDDGHRRWGLEQVVDDPEGDHDWRLVALVDLDASDEAGEPVISATRLVRR
ncbi:DEAD/DEAH box helicase [Lapillicoccus jejuensis]|uniref:DEAD/DEAH box helicase n=1 Tax=Lapillicoccus jejuensis TaxID=402171 RepID=UPI003CCC770C